MAPREECNGFWPFVESWQLKAPLTPLNKGCLSLSYRSYRLQTPKLSSAYIHLRQRPLHNLICRHSCSADRFNSLTIAAVIVQLPPGSCRGSCPDQIVLMVTSFVPTTNAIPSVASEHSDDTCQHLFPQPIKVVKYKPEIFTSCDTRIKQDCNTTVRSEAVSL